MWEEEEEESIQPGNSSVTAKSVILRHTATSSGQARPARASQARLVQACLAWPCLVTPAPKMSSRFKSHQLIMQKKSFSIKPGHYRVLLCVVSI